MARPTKSPDGPRTERFNLRFTLLESDHVVTQARLAGLSTHEYLRRRCLDYQVPAPTRVRSDPALITELNRLGVELRAIGNNANQLARSAHTGRKARAAWSDVVARIQELGEQVSTALEQIVLDDS